MIETLPEIDLEYFQRFISICHLFSDFYLNISRHYVTLYIQTLTIKSVQQWHTFYVVILILGYIFKVATNESTLH